MRRVPPSMLVREDLDRLLTGGAAEGENIVSALVETVTRLVVQELLEAEQADYLGGRGRYERRGEDQRGSRNGYEPGRLPTGPTRSGGSPGPTRLCGAEQGLLGVGFGVVVVLLSGVCDADSPARNLHGEQQCFDQWCGVCWTLLVVAKRHAGEHPLRRQHRLCQRRRTSGVVLRDHKRHCFRRILASCDFVRRYWPDDGPVVGDQRGVLIVTHVRPQWVRPPDARPGAGDHPRPLAVGGEPALPGGRRRRARRERV